MSLYRLHSLSEGNQLINHKDEVTKVLILLTYLHLISDLVYSLILINGRFHIKIFDHVFKGPPSLDFNYYLLNRG